MAKFLRLIGLQALWDVRRQLLIQENHGFGWTHMHGVTPFSREKILPVRKSCFGVQAIVWAANVLT